MNGRLTVPYFLYAIANENVANISKSTNHMYVQNTNTQKCNAVEALPTTI